MIISIPVVTACGVIYTKSWKMSVACRIDVDTEQLEYALLYWFVGHSLPKHKRIGLYAVFPTD